MSLRRGPCACPYCGTPLAHRRLARAPEPAPSSRLPRRAAPVSACPACGGRLRRSRAFVPVVLAIVAGYLFAKWALLDLLAPLEPPDRLTWRLLCLGAATLALYLAHLGLGYRPLDRDG